MVRRGERKQRSEKTDCGPPERHYQLQRPDPLPSRSCDLSCSSGCAQFDVVRVGDRLRRSRIWRGEEAQLHAQDQHQNRKDLCGRRILSMKFCAMPECSSPGRTDRLCDSLDESRQSRPRQVARPHCPYGASMTRPAASTPPWSSRAGASWASHETTASRGRQQRVESLRSIDAAVSNCMEAVARSPAAREGPPGRAPTAMGSEREPRRHAAPATRRA
jgi:hypothetical protein